MITSAGPRGRKKGSPGGHGGHGLIKEHGVGRDAWRTWHDFQRIFLALSSMSPHNFDNL
jgi:hypothetical protein